MQGRTVAVVGVLGLAVGWSLGGGLASQDPATRAGATPRGPRPLGVEQTRDAAPLTNQLRLKLDRQPAPPAPSRNPFVFGSRAPSAAPLARSSARPSAAVAADAVTMVPVEEARPVADAFVLSGIASTGGPDAPVFTAIISGAHGLLLVKRGDELPGGSVVADVQETTVTLKDSSGGERTLRLR